MLNIIGNRIELNEKTTITTKQSSLIFCGSYGCVIRPAYLCNKTFSKNNDLISKLFSFKKHWEDEINLNLKISKLDPKNLFSIKMIDNCEFIYTNEFKNNINFDKSSKKLIFDTLKPNDKVYQIIYEYGGIDLYELFKNPKLLYKINIVDFLANFINIFEGVHLLNSNNLYHTDIKPDNILFNFTNNKFYLIDYGLLTDFDYIYDLHSIHDFNNKVLDFYPNEFNILAYIIFTSNPTEKNIDYIHLNFNSLYKNILEDLFIQIKKKFVNIKNNHIKQLFNLIELINIKKDNLDDIKDIYTNFIKTFTKDKSLLIDIITNPNYYFINNELITDKAENIIIHNNINLICDNSNNIKTKIDVYMLGITIFYIILNIYIHLDEKNGIFNIPLGLFDLIAHMIDLNPCFRFNIKTALEQYKKIFSI